MKSLLSKRSLLLLYHFLINSQLSYCILNWCYGNKTLVKRLQRLCYKFVELISGINSNSSKVYSSMLRPAMVYGLETVAVTKKQVEEMEVAEMKMLRFAKGVTRKDKIRNEHIRSTVNVERLGIKMRRAG